ncbi:MAG: PHP domain-containing protein [Oscillospiraceae bacterium]|nr:PHP domain-containing protein [Oscillospiraceae bacterium]
MPYLYETHCHTKETSPCAKVGAAEAVGLYSGAGYSGIVITDHFTDHTVNKDNKTNWKNGVSSWLQGYRNAAGAAPPGFDVILGLEIRFPVNSNDYLVYGVTEELLYNNEYLYNMTLENFMDFADGNSLIVVQAHPFRDEMVIKRPNTAHGIEIYNGNPRHDARNNLAALWAEKFSFKIKTSGSDFHQIEDLARGGMYFHEKIDNNYKLANALKEGEYSFKIT